MEHPAVSMLREFADAKNWSDVTGHLEWIGARDVLYRAEHILNDAPLVCIKCDSPLPYGTFCPQDACPHNLGRVKVKKLRLNGK